MDVKNKHMLTIARDLALRFQYCSGPSLSSTAQVYLPLVQQDERMKLGSMYEAANLLKVCQIAV